MIRWILQTFKYNVHLAKVSCFCFYALHYCITELDEQRHINILFQVKMVCCVWTQESIEDISQAMTVKTIPDSNKDK